MKYYAKMQSFSQNKTNINPLVCKYCGRLCKNKCGLFQHEQACKNPDSVLNKKRQHKLSLPEIPSDLKCPYCNKQFSTRGSIQRHQIACKDENSAYNKKLRSKSLICQYCQKVFSNALARSRHEKGCGTPGSRLYKARTLKERIARTGLVCQYCGKVCKNGAGLKHHERFCLTTKKHDTSYNKNLTCRYCSRQFTNPGALCSHESRCASNINITEEQRLIRHEQAVAQFWTYSQEKQDEIRTRAAARPHVSRYKYGEYKGFSLDSSWELAFVVFCLENNINIQKNTESFAYTYLDRVHKYYPDFIIDNIYYEIKGQYTDKVRAKIDQFPTNKELIIIDKNTIKPYLNFTIAKYGKNFCEILYDKTKPSYLNRK